MPEMTYAEYGMLQAQNKRIAELEAELDKCKAENERLREDAARYRWLKKQYSTHGHYDKRLPTILDLHSEYWDVSIDAAREGE